MPAHTNQDMLITRVSSKGQLVIPHEIRDSCGIRSGTHYAITSRNGGQTLILERQSDRAGTMAFLEFAQALGKKYNIKAVTPAARKRMIMEAVGELDDRTKTRSKSKKAKRR
jgi:AbrB family looped-hinge helix DNA binding protein